MKKLLFVIIFSLNLLILYSQVSKKSINYYEETINKKVKQLTITAKYNDVYGQIVQFKQIKTFNRKGKIINKKELDSKDTVISIAEYIYDSDDRLIEVITTYSSNNYKYSISFKYDNFNNLIEEKNSGGRVVYQYNSKNNIIKQTVYSYNNYYKKEEISKYIEYVYNGNEQIVECNHYWTGDKPINYKYEYDNNGNIILEKEYYNNKISYCGGYSYNSKNQQIKKPYISEGIIGHIDIVYSDKDNVLSENIFVQEQHIGAHEYIYNRKGLIKEIKYYYLPNFEAENIEYTGSEIYDYIYY